MNKTITQLLLICFALALQIFGQEVAVKKSVAVKDVPKSFPLEDPFSMQPGAGGSLIPADGSAIPEGIHVVGILSVKGGKRIAVIQVPGEPDCNYVEEGDLIQVRAAASKGLLYLKIVSIKNQSIEISPHTHPQEVRVYR